MNLEQEINSFEPISLEKMDAVKLMNRTDVKYVFGQSLLPDVLEGIKQDYFILETSNTRAASYQTLYFDTPKNKFYLQHHNGKRNRYKVRYRSYLESDLTFFEIKHKNSKGRVVKERIKVAGIPKELGEDEKVMVAKKIKKSINLEPRLENTFNRLTLVAKEGVERLTIDFNLAFKYNEADQDMPGLSIIEVKQERYSRNSKVMEILRQLEIRPQRMSKYAIGMSIFSGEKANNFKEKRLRINKIMIGDDL